MSNKNFTLLFTSFLLTVLIAACGNQNAETQYATAVPTIAAVQVPTPTPTSVELPETQESSDSDADTSQLTGAPIINRQLEDDATERQDGQLYLKTAGEESAGPDETWPGRELSLGILNLHADKGGELTSTSAGQLELAWHYVGEDLVSHTPLLYEGRLYFADWGGKVYAADPETGEILWEKSIASPHRPWPWHGFAGTGTFGEGMLFEASAEGEAFAIDPENGDVIWQTTFVEQADAGNLSDLLYYDGLVYIGVQSVSEGLDAGFEDFEPTFRGNVVALDAQSGEIIWRSYMVESPQTGAAVWSSFALDIELNALYFTTSNNYTGEPSLTSDALISLDAKSGEMRWARQTTEGDVWTPAEPYGSDYGYGAGAQLFEATIDGEVRKLVASGQKSGFYHTFDRDTGERIWSAFAGFGHVGGGIRGEASISGERIYIWSNNSYKGTNSPLDYPMSVRALDAATGHNLWFYDRAQPAGGAGAGFLINDVYFVGSLDGTLHGYNASTGELVWETLAPGAISSSVNVVNDTLYVGIGIPRVFGGDPNAKGVLAYKLR